MLRLPRPEMIHLLPACLGKACSTHWLSHELAKVCLLPDRCFPDSIWVKVREGFLPMGTEELRKFFFL